MESMGKKPRRRRSFTAEFKAEIVELCQRGDRSVGQVAKDFDLTETAVREWVRQAERDAGTGGRGPDQRRAAGAGRAAAGEQAAARGRGHPQAGDGFLREGDPVNCYPFIEAEKSRRRNVKRACELLKVSRSAYYAARGAEPSDRAAQDAELAAQVQAVHQESKGRYGSPRVHAELRRQGQAALPQAGRPADARRPGCGPGGEAVEEDHHPGPGRRRAGGPDPPGLHRRRLQAEHPLVRRHHLHPDLGGLALPISYVESRRVGP